MNNFYSYHLESYPQSYPQTFWLPSDVPGFDGGFSTPVRGFSWGDSFRSQNRDGVVNIYIGNRIT